MPAVYLITDELQIAGKTNGDLANKVFPSCVAKLAGCNKDKDNIRAWESDWK